MQQVFDSFFGGFGDVFGLISFEEQQVDQQEEQPCKTEGKGKLVIESKGGEHGFALDPSLKTGFLKCTAKRTSR